MTTGSEGNARPVADVMSTEVYTLTPDTVVASARRLASESGAWYLLVLANGTLNGIVTVRDLQIAKSDDLIGSCMTSPVKCITPDTTIEDALEMMENHNIGCLPVVTQPKLLGIVTRKLLSGETASPASSSNQGYSTAN